MPPGRKITTFAFVLSGVWILLGLLVVPPVLRSAFSGTSLPVLNGLLAGAAEIPPEFFLQQWYQIAWIGAAAILIVAAFAIVLSRPERVHRMVGEARPSDLGAIRMLVCAVLLASTLWEDLASSAVVPREMIRPMGVIQLLYMLPIGFDRFAASPEALTLFKWFTAVALFLGMVGWQTRIALPVAAACYLILGGLLRHYAWFYHTGLVPWYMLVILSLLPAHLGLSIDRRLAAAKGRVVEPDRPSLAFGWMRFVIWTALAMPYVMAGLSKLRNGGLDWWEATNFKFILFQGALKPMHFDFDVSLLLVSAPDWVFEFMGIMAIAGEIAYGAVLFSRRARWLMPAGMLLMHIGILLLQNILFFDLIILQAVFFNWRPLTEPLARRISRYTSVAAEFLAPLGPPAHNPRPVRFGSSVFTVTLVGALAFFWVFRIEFYPLTGMQMFSKKRSQPVSYEVPLARLSSGEVVRAPIEECIGSMADGRYRRVLEMAFTPEGERITDEFLTTCIVRWNREAPAHRHIAEIELQLWQWDYLSEPESPTYGRMIERKVFTAAAPDSRINAASSADRQGD